jgi:alpha-glucoside transport system substrate-binding protein
LGSTKSSALKTFALVGAVALTSTACLGGSGGSSSGSTAATTKTKISIMFAFGNDQTQGFKDSLNPWAQQNGLEIDYQQTNNFETLIQTKVAGGDTPDIAIFPQPGILTGIAAKGKLAELSSLTDVSKLTASILPGFLSATTVNGRIYGAPVSMNVKSLYWYDKAQFAAKGYTVPKTQVELEALFAKIKADGTAPLCIGLESGSATGWPGTDWIEDYVLQTGGPDVYDKWVKHEVKFDSPEVRRAFEIYNRLVMTDGYAYGGAKSAVSTAFGTALNPMFKAPPGCYTGKQGNFITQKGFFPDDVFANLDTRVGVFQTPSLGENRVLGGGDLAGVFNANDVNVKKVFDKITNDPTFGAQWAKTGGFLSPHKSFDKSAYPNQTLKDIATLAAAAPVFRFDGSDQMPGKVGSGSFWTGMVNYTSGAANLETTLREIDASWPTTS